MNSDSLLSESLRPIIKLISDQYKVDNRPWYVGFSGGKDSTALFAAVYIALQGLPHFHKKIEILYCDTGVEIPLVSEYVRATLLRIGKQAKQDGLPIVTKIVRPRIRDRFFVKLIGRGYPPPTNKFRWCTDRLRVGPVRREINGASSIPSLMLLGTRWNESPERARTLTRFLIGGRNYFRQDGNSRATIFAPIANLSTRQIWEFLQSRSIPRALDVAELSALYRSASAGVCPGQCERCLKCKGSRFGCWTCTVIRKDRAVFNMVNDGYPQLAPLLQFRDWLANIRGQPRFRRKLRRNGTPGLGPFTIGTRKNILSKLQETENLTPWRLILPAEIELIKRCWESDGM